MIKAILTFCISTVIAFPLYGQLEDDFSDGDFSNNPEWLGQTELFTVLNETLQLFDENPESSNTAYIYVPAATSTNQLTTWEFSVLLDFAPSSSNFSRVYLNAASPNFDENPEGYFLQVGGISGSDDALELIRQDGSSSILLISGTTGAVGSDPAVASVQITRTPEGEWTLRADYSGGTDYQEEGTAVDNTYPMGGFFGFYCVYTSTRSEAFFYDDVLIDPLFTDIIPPSLIEVQTNNSTTLVVAFNEPLDPISAENISNYTISNGIGTPSNASLVAGDPTRVELNLASPLMNGQEYEITLNNIGDINSNISGEQTSSFTFFDIQPADFQDVIISEIMADPNPVVGLPQGEYIELYNRSDKVIQTSTLFFSAGSTPVQLPSFLLLPDSYVAIVDEDLLSEYDGSLPILGLNNFPALTNSTDDLTLTDENGTSLFEVSYEDDWYDDSDKSNGGYSLELVDPEGIYSCPGNWSASLASSGGTPGLVNSWLGSIADQFSPFVSSAFAENEMEVFVQFSELMDLGAISSPDNYTISNGINVESVNYQGNNRILLMTDNALEPGIRYELTIDPSVTDCIGNAIENEAFPLGLTSTAEAQDIVINEVLFNPVPGSFDFIELYNRSNKAINLNGLTIKNKAKETGDTIDMVTEDYILFPDDFVVLTDDPDDILTQFTVQQARALIAGDLPTLDDKSGNITLILNDISLDSFDYNESYHYPLLDSEEGVSLERLSPNSNTQDAGNWHSASETAGFGTPTYQNSQFFPNTVMIDQSISLPYTTFSPDGDGFQDVLIINYQLDAPGYNLNLRIFDSQGRAIRQLANNELLPVNGTIQWDGTNSDQSRARIGIYVLWIELFLPDGTIERDKIACVLAGQLD